MRPKPLMPTRTVTDDLPPERATVAARRDATGRPSSRRRAPSARRDAVRATALPAPSRVRRDGVPAARRGLRRRACPAVRLASVSGMPRSCGALVGHRQQPADPAGDRVLGQRRVGQLAELLEDGLLVLEPQLAGRRAGGRGPRRRGSPAPARPGRRRRPRPAPSGAGWRRRSWPAGWRWPAPRGASGAPPRPARASCAPSRVSSAPMASPSRITTRSTPRTSRALAGMPSRRAAPTSASAASGPGQVTSSADERPGSVSEPWARNAPRQAASASQAAPDDDLRRQPAHRTAAAVEQAGLPGQRLAVLDDPDDVAAALAQAAGGEHDDVAGVAVDLGDVACAAAGRPRRCRARPRPRSGRRRCAGRRRTAASRTPRPCGSRAWSPSSRLSSSFTAAVIAMRRSCHASSPCASRRQP